MPESVFSGLLHTLDKCSVSELATRFGESEQRVSRGMESSVASVLGAMARRSDDFDAMQRMLDLVPQDSGDISWSKLAGGLANPRSPWTVSGRTIVSAVFGSAADTVAHLVGREAEVSPETAAAMLGTAAPMALSFLRRRVQDGGLSLNGLSAILHKESGTIRSALPAGLCDLLWRSQPGTTAAVSSAYPPERHETSGTAWIGALGVALVALGSLWIWSHIHRGGVEMGRAATGAANRIAGEAGSLGSAAKTGLPGGLERKASDTESQLVETLRANDATGHPSWVNFDRLKFDSGSATLSADSGGQLDQIAATLKGNPHLHLTIAGHTDNVGSNAQNLRLSWLRADQVKSALVARAISSDRIATEGLGDQYALGDNSTEEGRAMNRRVSMRVTQP